jgi:hypothetical protein
VEDQLRFLVALAFAGLLIMLRLDAERFGAAEYEADQYGQPATIRRRFAWYVLGVALIFAVDLVHPSPGTGLLLGVGNPGEALIFGLAFGVVGTLLVLAIAWVRGRGVQLPSPQRYPDGLVNAVATAFIDEAAFRGIILAFLLATGMEVWAANLMQAIVYTLVTRVGAPGRELPMVGLTLVLGVFGGWLTIITGGIGAAFVGHAVTRFALFLVASQPGRVFTPGVGPDDDAYPSPSGGWRAVGAGDARSYGG